LHDVGALLTRTDAGLAFAAASLATFTAWLAERFISLDDLSMVFIVAVVLVASRTRMTAAVLAAGLCFLSYNFFFIEPRLTLFIGARQGVATVFLFLAAALVAGRLASRLRMQVVACAQPTRMPRHCRLEPATGRGRRCRPGGAKQAGAR
jgi:two-component system sensor histidine kinase KdpD